MRYFLILLLFAGFSAIEAIIDYRNTKQAIDKPFSEHQRVRLYKSIILWGWLRPAFYFGIAVWLGLSLPEMGLAGISMNRFAVHTLFAILSLVASGGLLLVTSYQIIMYLCSAAYREALAKVIASRKSTQGIDPMLPRTRREKQWFTVCSVTAAIGEELVFRGFLIHLLTLAFPTLHSYVVLLISAALFMLLHIYQGIHNLAKVLLTGILFGALFLSTGSLLLPVLLHFVLDFSSCFLPIQDTPCTKSENPSVPTSV